MTKGKESKEIVEKEETQLQQKFVSGINGQPSGLEDLDPQTDIKIPRVAILQSLSHLVTDGKGTIGQLANSLTGEIYGESFEFIPLFSFKTRVKFLIGKGAVCMSRNALTSSFGDEENGGYSIGTNCIECKDASWHGQEAPSCSIVYNFLALDINNLMAFPVVISCMKTGIKEAKNLISMAAFSGEDLCARVYRMTTKKEDKGKGVYYEPRFELVRRVEVEEYNLACAKRDSMREKPIEVDMESDFDTEERGSA